MNIITEAAAEQIRAMHAQGRRVRELAREHGVSPTTIARTIKMQLHVPASVKVVPVVLTRRLYALAALRAAEHGVTVDIMLQRLLDQALGEAGGAA